MISSPSSKTGCPVTIPVNVPSFGDTFHWSITGTLLLFLFGNTDMAATVVIIFSFVVAELNAKAMKASTNTNTNTLTSSCRSRRRRNFHIFAILEVSSNLPTSTQLNSTQLNSTQLNSARLGSARLGSARLLITIKSNFLVRSMLRPPRRGPIRWRVSAPCLSL